MEEKEEWFTLDDIELSDNSDTLYCISVDSPDKQFLAGKLGIPTHNTDQGKEEDALKGEAGMIIGSIARLGRAAGVHLIIATQRPDAKIISGETKANLGVRVNAGRTDSNASNMILGTSDGVRVKAHPRGRLYLRIYGNGDHGQGFFAPQEWIDEYLAENGMNPDGSPLTGNKSKLANIADMSQFEGETLDDREGIDNSAAIEQIREEEANSLVDELHEGDDEFNIDDESFDEGGGATIAGGPDPNEDRPILTNGKDNDSNPWDRPEDDWDSDLEDLIDQNFNNNHDED